MADQLETRAARRYTDALYDLARESGAVDAVVADVVALKGAIDGAPDDLRRAIDPKLGRAAKWAIMQEKFLSGRHKLVANLLGVLFERRREALIPAVFAAFAETMDHARNVLHVEVETATPLDATTEADVLRRLTETTGRPVVIEARVKPELLGGMRFFVDSKLIDGTVASRLDRLKKHLLEVRA